VEIKGLTTPYEEEMQDFGSFKVPILKIKTRVFTGSRTHTKSSTMSKWMISCCTNIIQYFSACGEEKWVHLVQTIALFWAHTYYPIPLLPVTRSAPHANPPLPILSFPVGNKEQDELLMTFVNFLGVVTFSR